MMRIFLPVLLLLALLSSCGSSSPPEYTADPVKDRKSSTEKQEQTEIDVTASMLGRFTGDFTSIAGGLVIHPDGAFTLETSDEAVSWTARQAPQRQFSVYCGFRRQGTVAFVQKKQNLFIKLQVKDRSVLGARRDERRQPPYVSDPWSLCSKSAQGFDRESASLVYQISGLGQGAFWLTSPQLHAQTQYLDAFKDSDADGSSSLSGEFALLFSTRDHGTDVTDLVSNSLTTLSFKGSDYATNLLSGGTLEVSPALRKMRLRNPQCGIDLSLDFSIVTQGSRIFMKLGNSAPTLTMSAAADPTSGCAKFSSELMSAHPGQNLFDLTDLSLIEGLTIFRGMYFEKLYR